MAVREFAGERGEAFFSACHENEVVTLCGEVVCECCAYSS